MKVNKAILHVEGLFVFILCLYMYHYGEFSWLLFIALFFLPDLSMFGYLYNNRFGAKLYNVFHTYSVTIVVIIVGLLLDHSLLQAIGIIWTAHIGMDRMFGLGLKYSTDFKDTHFNRI